MGILTFVIGTLVLTLAGQVLTVPITRALLERGRGFGSPDTTYTAVDIAVMAVLGFSMGAVFRAPFIGIVLGPRGWAGMLAFILASFLGSRL